MTSQPLIVVLSVQHDVGVVLGSELLNHLVDVGHLAGALAAHSLLPVLGIPVDAGPLKGQDALLSTVMMPPGVPVGTLGIGSSGAKNAALLAARILALSDEGVATRLQAFVEADRQNTLAKDRDVQERYS